jgi:hypothetical protein
MSLSYSRSLWVRPFSTQRPQGMQQQQMADGAEPFTEAQREALQNTLNATVNGAIAARLKTFEDKLTPKLAESFGKLLDDKLKDFRAPPADPDPDPAGGKGGKGKDVELATLKKAISELTGKFTESETARQAAEQRIRQRDMQSTVMSELASHKIDGLRAKGAFAILLDRIVDDAETGSLLWREDDGQSVDLKTGLKGWVKTEEAALYLPPSGARGSGSSARQAGGAPLAPLTPKQLQDRAWQDIADQF